MLEEFVRIPIVVLRFKTSAKKSDMGKELQAASGLQSYRQESTRDLEKSWNSSWNQNINATLHRARAFDLRFDFMRNANLFSLPPQRTKWHRWIPSQLSS
jgi:hypothetical protein